MRPSLKNLQHFIAIADTGQVSRAAQRCHVTQSTMTASLKALEEIVGAALFSRHAGGVRLTEAGNRFLRHAQRIEAVMDEAMGCVALMPSRITGLMKIGVTETISAYVLAPLVRELEKKFPELELSFVEEDRAQIEARVRDGSLDMAILLASNLSENASLPCQLLMHSPRQLWGHPEHPLMSANRVRLSDVASQRYILLDMDEHVSTVEKYWRHYRLQPDVGFRSSSIEAVRSLVAAGRGVTILSDLVYRPWSLDGHRIVRRQLADPVPSMDVGLVWDPERTQSPGFPEVKDYLLDSFRNILKP